MITKAIKPKKQVLIKFLLLCCLMIGYFGYLSYEYDILTGGITALLTWSFFVLCTPIADAGFLLDFPLRLLFGVRMFISEMFVWLIAILINISSLIYVDTYYETTLVTRLLHQILTSPYPYWGIILLSLSGTFLSVKFGDELMDVIHHRDRNFFHSHQFKHELIMVFFFIVIIFSYYEMVKSLGIKVDL